MQLGTVTPAQGIFTKKVLKIVLMLDINNKKPPPKQIHWEQMMTNIPLMKPGSMPLLWKFLFISPATPGLSSSLQCTSAPVLPTIQ